ncbi:MAG TPA: sugar transferase [Ktedonobacterales bacterium]|jgi:exopolysaccharide biosynthesis polyprenyl glycosylphosphotransferase
MTKEIDDLYTTPVDTPSGSARRQNQTRPPRALQMPVSERRLLLMAGDVIASEISVFVALALWAQHAHMKFNADFIGPQIHWFLILPALWLLIATSNDYYNLRIAARVGASLRRLALIVAEVLVVYLATFFLSQPGSLPRRFIVYYAALSLVLVGLWRAARIFLIGWTGFRRRALVVGAGHEADLIWQTLKDEAAGDYELLGLVAGADELATVADPQRYLGVGGDLRQLVAEYGVTELVMAYTNDVPADVFEGLLACYESGVQVTPMTRLYEQITGRLPIEHMTERLWSLVLPDEAHSLRANLYALWKRVMDIILAVIGLTIFVVLSPLLALIIVLDSRGPMFYTQTRLGLGGKPFRIVKLRSMVVDAEHGVGPQWAQDNDTRITRVGKFLRRSRIDEVPQLINVLRGEMSIIGPRPERPEFVETLARDIPYYRARLAVKPGLTGWAQVRYRYGNTQEDALRKLQYDLYYIRHQSPLLDLLITMKTISTMVTFAGT